MSASNTSGVNQALDFEWNVYEGMQQALDWYTLPSEQTVMSGTSSSPESVPYFNPDPNAFLPQSLIPSAPARPSRGPKKSPSARTRRQTQNREAQRAFRIRQRQRFEDLEAELHLLRSRHESLQEKYASLNLLYMQRVGFDGSMHSAGSMGTVSTAESSRCAESEVGFSQVGLKEYGVEIQTPEPQQGDVAAWLSATGQMN